MATIRYSVAAYPQVAPALFNEENVHPGVGVDGRSPLVPLGRVFRGGSFRDFLVRARIRCRLQFEPDENNDDIGVRFARPVVREGE